MSDGQEQPDPPLTPEQEVIVASLSGEFLRKVDSALLSHAKHSWRKVAMLVGLAMMDPDLKVAGLPDLFFSKRVRGLVEAGLLQSAGNLDFMRYSEVRLPNGGQVET